MFRSSVFLLFICFTQRYFCLRNEGDEGDCTLEPGCLKCGPKGCIKCQNRIVFPTRKCVDVCPVRHVERWSTMVDYMGRLCKPSATVLNVPEESLPILAGIVVGSAMCVAIVVSAVAYVRYKQGRTRRRQDVSSESDDVHERQDFLKQVEILRPYTNYFLDMLNEARRQFRQNSTNTNVTVYRQVIQDLAKLLIILNRPIVDLVTPPEDWDRIYSWATRVIKRRNTLRDSSEPQMMAQLVSFLQNSGSSEDEPNCSRGTTLSTFKPEQQSGSSLSLREAAIRNFSSNYDSAFPASLNPQWMFDYSLVSGNSMSASQFNAAVWQDSKESLNGPYVLDDDFCQLGFRPQDEITTEL